MSVKSSQCPICRRESNLLLKESYGAYTLWECAVCAGQFWEPMKNPGASWYEADERYSFRNQNPLKIPEHDHREFLKDTAAFRQANSKSRLLDVGMGTGNFLVAAENAGYDVYGIDFDRGAVEAAKKVFGLEHVYALDIDGALQKFGRDFFDAATMFQVLEHLENPSEFIGKVRDILKPSGYLAISVPYRGFWGILKPGDRPPRHLTRWDERSIKNFLEASGFEIVKMKKLPAPLKYLVKKFHFWTSGFLSFGMVGKISAKTKNKTTVAAVHSLAKTKDYLLFFLPAILFYALLALARKHYLDLYVFARRRDLE